MFRLKLVYGFVHLVLHKDNSVLKSGVFDGRVSHYLHLCCLWFWRRGRLPMVSHHVLADEDFGNLLGGFNLYRHYDFLFWWNHDLTVSDFLEF